MANRLSQLRPYSYADLVLLLAAAGARGMEFVACSGLWFGFLIFLEWEHKDNGRARWPWWAWAVPWTATAVYVHSLAVVPALVLSVVYAQKKKHPIAALVAPVVNGGLKASLLLLVGAASLWFALGVWLVTSVRNLFGDFRDVVKDREEGIQTIPVRAGLDHDITWLYPVTLGATTLGWVVYGALPWWTLIVAWFVEWTTYRLTPR